MDSNLPTTNTQEPTESKLNIWQWVTQSNTRITGIFLLGLAFVLILSLIVLITSQNSPKKEETTTIPETDSDQVSQLTQPFLPSPTPDQTTNWETLKNTNGFTIKYPEGSKLTPSLPQATQSAGLQVTSDESTIAVEVTAKKASLNEAVNSLREKNSTSSANIKVNKILTKPISILYGGNEGYEWYLESNGLNATITIFLSKMGKNRVIQFEKNNKHYLIFTSFNDIGEQLLSTFSLNP